jgi:predicted transcriptional regulator
MRIEGEKPRFLLLFYAIKHKNLSKYECRMRLPELKAIKNMRKQLKINQQELAKEAKVSQSLIARLESGKVDPSYSKVKKIFTALEKMGSGKILNAKSIMKKKVISVSPNKSIKEVAAIMRKNSISQLPIIDDNVVLGSITEKDIMDAITKKDMENISLVPVKEIMKESFPQLDEDSPISVVSMVLEYTTAVLITKKGKVVGIITKSDILKIM